jgi:hypothetical protein
MLAHLLSLCHLAGPVQCFPTFSVLSPCDPYTTLRYLALRLQCPDSKHAEVLNGSAAIRIWMNEPMASLRDRRWADGHARVRRVTTATESMGYMYASCPLPSSSSPCSTIQHLYHAILPSQAQRRTTHPRYRVRNVEDPAGCRLGPDPASHRGRIRPHRYRAGGYPVLFPLLDEADTV